MNRRTLCMSGVLAVSLASSSAPAFTVRTDRPRLLFSAGTGPGITKEAYRARCTSDVAYASRCQAGLGSGTNGSYPALSHAAKYIVTGDAAACTAAYDALSTVAKDAPGSPDPHGFISNNGRAMVQLAVARDYCDPVLSEAQKAWLEQTMVAWGNWYLANPPGDVFHDDMPNVWNAVALAGLSLKGTASDADAGRFLAAADTQLKTVILPAMAYEGDFWHEGMTYVQPSLGSLAWYAAAWSTATDEDVHAWAKANVGDLFEGYFAFLAYSIRPDDKFVYFGDTSDNKQSVELFTRPVVDLLGYPATSALGQGLSMYVRDHSRPAYDYSGADGYLMALLYDVTRESSATALASLPKARWLSPKAADVAVLRSGWTADDTYVWVSCGDYFGAHQHDEAGAFQIFRHAILSGSTGYYDAFDSDHWANYYSQHSVHANTLAVFQPGEIFPTSATLVGGVNVNDGGQRPLRRTKDGTGYPSPDLATYQKNKTGGSLYETGDLTTFEVADCYDYVACDVTAAYDSALHGTNGNAPKVKEVTRQFVFIPPEIVVVFDRVEATDAAYDKRFLLHAAAAPVVAGATVTITNGSGRLFAQTLLPAQAATNVRTGFDVGGTPHPPATTGAESGGTRVEVSPSQHALRDYFLHVLKATAATDDAAPTATVTEDDASATVTVVSSGASFAVQLMKTGAVGGHFKGGACDQALGAKAVVPEPYEPTEAGPERPGAADSSASTGTGGTPGAAGGAALDGALADGGAGEAGGCGCRTGPGSAVAWAPHILAVIFLVGRRRRSSWRCGTGLGARL